MIKIKNSQRDPFRLDLVPMINVVFLLLIFFMLTSTFTKQNVDIDLPEAISSNDISNKNLILKIGKDGTLEIDGAPTNKESLLLELTNRSKLNKKTVVEVQADKNIEFELFGEILSSARLAGIEEFIFTTKTF